MADTRIHGTTRRRWALFRGRNARSAAVAPSSFPCFHEAGRTVHRDSYVEVGEPITPPRPNTLAANVGATGQSLRASFQPRREQIALHSAVSPESSANSRFAPAMSPPLRDSWADTWIRRAALAQPAVDG